MKKKQVSKHKDQLFSQIRPTSLRGLSTQWEGAKIQASIFVEGAIQVDYFFYSTPFAISTKKKTTPLEIVSLHANEFTYGELWCWEGLLQKPYPYSRELGYLIRVHRQTANGEHELFWIVDPTARESTGGEEWGVPYAFEIEDDGSLIKRKIERPLQENHLLPRLPVLRKNTPLPARPQKPNLPKEECIVYECHVRGMTKHFTAPVIHPKHQGTYRGLTKCIPYLKNLGINVIELLPIFDFDETENPNYSPLSQKRLLNYWGYSPLLFFAPKQGYAFSKRYALEEFKEMIDAFHRAGIEVWLDVVFNHTAELDDVGPAYHFKTLSPNSWYLHDQEQTLANYSGTGNTLNASQPIVKQMITHCLEYWSSEVGVDGFRFDLSSILNRSPSGAFWDFPHFLWELQQHPALAQTKLIAEPWDAGGGYQVGHFSTVLSKWSEWNDQFRDCIRKVIRGDEGMMSPLKQAILGSPHLYRNPYQSLNFITAHDGMTALDLVSYNHKHNEENGEDNRDGHNQNYSFNCGEEGATENEEIQKLRFQKLHSLLALLLFSKGIPMLLAGDEMGRTQQGNNNAYCLDNEVTWLNWNLLTTHAPLYAFSQHLLSLRKKFHILLFSEESIYEWHNSEGNAEDLSHHVQTLAWKVTHPEFPSALYFMFNGYHQPLSFRFSDQSRKWIGMLDTSKADGQHGKKARETTKVDAFSLKVFVGKPIE